jgi:antirestriction protein ArdC
MPPRESFRAAESYAATLAHELIHSTAYPSRCARELGKRFGDRAYAAEELIAEMGAAFLCADLRITPDVREDHAQYLGHWLAVLKSDRRAIFTAAAQAQRAADYLHSLQPQPAPEPLPRTRHARTTQDVAWRPPNRNASKELRPPKLSLVSVCGRCPIIKP